MVLDVFHSGQQNILWCWLDLNDAMKKNQRTDLRWKGSHILKSVWQTKDNGLRFGLNFDGKSRFTGLCLCGSIAVVRHIVGSRNYESNSCYSLGSRIRMKRRIWNVVKAPETPAARPWTPPAEPGREPCHCAPCSHGSLSRCYPAAHGSEGGRAQRGKRQQFLPRVPRLGEDLFILITS